MDLKDTEIKSILAEVTASLQAAKKSEADKLSKAVGEEASPTGDESAPPAESAAPAAPEASESAPAPSPEMSDAPPAAPEGAPPADPAMGDPAMAGADPAMAGDPAADAAPADPAMLAQEYAKLDDEQLKMHYMACKQAVFERMQGAASADPAASAGAPPAPLAASPAPASPPAAGASPAMKGEMAADGNVDPVTKPGSQKLDQATGPGASLSGKQEPVSDASHAGLPVEKEVAKSEQVKELEQQVEGLVKAVNLLINQPQTIRKAVTSVAVLERSEALEKSEKPAAKKLAPEDMKSHLTDLIRSGKLNKNEKAAVLSFYETKNPAHLEKIAHLFE